jgi:nicotinate-nucleotide adenylyltransferase
VRLGIFGGTFDPPHVGHLLAASDASEVLELDRLLFVPAGSPPFKAASVEAAPEQRLEMVVRMIGDDTRFGADPVEIERKGLSYTAETLGVLAERYPHARRFFLIGEDLADQIATWREPERIASLAEIVVLARGVPAGTPVPRLRTAIPLRRIVTRRIEVSSTEIRERVRAGKSIHGFVTDAVAAYVRAAELYR